MTENKSMMQRLKLIELLDTNCGYVDEQPAVRLADYLIQNGVVLRDDDTTTISTGCDDYPGCKGCPIRASGGCDEDVRCL